MPEAEHDYTVTLVDAARMLGVHQDTMRRWAEAGKIHGWKTPGGWWRFRDADLRAVLPADEPVA